MSKQDWTSVGHFSWTMRLDCSNRVTAKAGGEVERFSNLHRVNKVSSLREQVPFSQSSCRDNIAISANGST